MTISVLIADDQELVRKGMRLILDREPDITVIDEASDGVHAISSARQLRPDVCLVDIRMPKLDGLDVTRALLTGPARIDTKVVIVTTFDVDEYVVGAINAGAVGFVLKDAGPSILVEAVRAAYNDEALISPAITVRMLKKLAAPMTEASRSGHPLSDRELEVARLVAAGRSNAEIAATLSISLSTAKGHVAAAQAKLGVRNRVEIAAWIWRRGLAD